MRMVNADGATTFEFWGFQKETLSGQGGDYLQLSVEDVNQLRLAISDPLGLADVQRFLLMLEDRLNVTPLPGVRPSEGVRGNAGNLVITDEGEVHHGVDEAPLQKAQRLVAAETPFQGINFLSKKGRLVSPAEAKVVKLMFVDDDVEITAKEFRKYFLDAMFNLERNGMDKRPTKK